MRLAIALGVFVAGCHGEIGESDLGSVSRSGTEPAPQAASQQVGTAGQSGAQMLPAQPVTQDQGPAPAMPKDPFAGLPHRYTAIYDSQMTITLRWDLLDYHGGIVQKGEIRIREYMKPFRLLKTLTTSDIPDLAQVSIGFSEIPGRVSSGGIWPQFQVQLFDDEDVVLLTFTIIPAPCPMNGC